MPPKELYDSGIIGMSEHIRMSFTVTAAGGNDELGVRTATATLSLGAEAMMSRVVINAADARQLASELVKAADAIDDYVAGRRLDQNSNEQIEANPSRHLLGEPS